MEDENEVLSASDPSDSSDEYTADHEEDEEEEEEEEEELEDSNNEDEPSLGPSAPSDEDRKSKNVDALLRYHLFCYTKILALRCDLCVCESHISKK